MNKTDQKGLVQQESNLLRAHKDSVFRMLFKHKEKAMALYQAISGKKLSEDTPFEFTTLEEVMFKTRKNDISFLLEDTFIIMLEHQSSLNDNMTVRDLLYYAETLQRMFSNKEFYKRSKVEIPRPEFIMLYNGTEELPDFSTVNLSDNFRGEGEINLQLTLKVYNINDGRNPEIMAKCKTLQEYSRFVSIIREEAKREALTDRVLQRIFNYCIEHDILADFLTKYGTEVISMLFAELTEEEALELAKEDGFEQGFKDGFKDGRQQGLQQGLEQGLQQGEARITKLTELLLEAGRHEALQKSLKDKEYQKQLLEEFNL